MGHCSCVWFGLEAVRVKEVKRRKIQQSKQKTVRAYMGVLWYHGRSEKSRFYRCCVASQEELWDYQGGKREHNENLGECH